MKIIIITGPPYSGKGTQCDVIKEVLGYKHISTGDVCREEKENQTTIGQALTTYEQEGDLVPDSLMQTLLGQTLAKHKNSKGVILDGYPRTVPQVNDLMEVVKEQNGEIDKVIHIEVLEEELLKRAAIRAKDSTRADDKGQDKHLKRIRVYQEETLPAIEVMKNKYEAVTINGMGTIEEITEKIKQLFE